MPRPARRRIACLIGAIAAAAAPVASAAAAGPAPLTEAQAQQVGTDAYVYGVSLMEFLRQQRQQTSVTTPDALADAPINQLGNDRSLATPSNQVFVAPNLDTLYTMGHLDLSRGPQVLHVPAVSGGRYYSFEFLDPYTNVFHYLGTRTTGDRAANYVIVGPGFHGKLPTGVHRVTSTYAHIWLVGRTQVRGASDVPAVRKIQNGYKLVPLTDFQRVGLHYAPPRSHPTITSPTTATVPTGLAYFDALGDALAQNPPPARDHAILAELRTVGIGPGLHPSTENLPPATVAGLQAAAAGGLAKVASLRASFVLASKTAHHGWYVLNSDVGAWGTDYDSRAVVSVYGIAANRPAEAMYPYGVFDNSGSLLDGAHRYVMHFAPDQLPPAKYFWSITMYNAQDYLAANPIDRYSVGSQSGLKRNADGSLDLYIQSTQPVGHQSNWLPSPTSGSFVVIMRMYGPEASALDGTYSYPPITKVG